MKAKREKYLTALINGIGDGMIKVITGIRRCGKSYLLFTLFKEYLVSTGIKESEIIEITLDDESFLSLRNPLNLGEYIRSKVTNKKKHYFVLIDEIQFAQKIENPYVAGDFITFYEVLNGLLRFPNVDVYVTGSNSKMLSSDILTEFRGRGNQIRIFPLSFAEFYAVKKGDFSDRYAEYQRYGGLPKAVSLSDDEKKSSYLKNLYDEVYLKDIVQRNGIKNENALSTLVDVLASSVGSYTNPANISNTFKSNKTTYEQHTVAKHIKFLEDAFLISEAQRYNIKGRKYIGANSKFYFTDVGLRNAKLNFRQIESTHLMENIIYNELLIRGYNVDVGIVEINSKNEKNKTERKQLEVDFVASKGIQKFYIQSAFSLEDNEKLKQEKRPLEKIDDSFRKIIIQRENQKPWIDENGFLYLGIKDFLLDENATPLLYAS